MCGIVRRKKLVIGRNNVVISYNEDYNEELSIVDEDRYLYYQNNIDFYPKDDAMTLEKQIQLAKEIKKNLLIMK